MHLLILLKRSYGHGRFHLKIFAAEILHYFFSFALVLKIFIGINDSLFVPSVFKNPLIV